MAYRGFKYRLYPNEDQKDLLQRHFGSVKFIYNYFLELLIENFEKTGKSLNPSVLLPHIVVLKRGRPWLKDVNSQSLQRTVINLETSFCRAIKNDNFKFPNFKRKELNRYSFQMSQNYKIEDGKLYLPKFKKSGIKIKLHREFSGKMQSLTISKTDTNKYYASILVDTDEEPISPKPLRKNTTIGIDLGIKNFLVTSDGEEVQNPRYAAKADRRLRIACKKLDRKKRGSKNWHKQKLKIAKMREKIVNQRREFLHAQSLRLVRNNQSICIESLNIQEMLKNKYMVRHILDTGWGIFVNQLKYKSLQYGVNLVAIDKYAPSSQTCNVCGYRNKQLKLSQRFWVCPECNTRLDRDKNAAKNIKDFGIKKYQKEIP